MVTVSELKQYFETLTLESVGQMERFYTPDAYFRDPFNEVSGLDKVKPIFAHMFEALHEPRFVILEQVLQGDRVVLTWDFTFRIKNYKPEVTQCIHGLSLLRLASDGRVAWHRDYWDAAGELYEKLPLIGGLMRWLKRKFA